VGSISQSEREARRERERRRRQARRRLGVLGTVLVAGVAAAVVAFASAGGSASHERSGARARAGRPARGGKAARTRSPTRAVPATLVHIGSIPPAQPGAAHVFTHGPTAGRMVALTFDDGFCPACVERIVGVLLRTGAHATFFPNGQYARSWDPQAARIRTLVQRGQLIVGNHTFHHVDSAAVGSAAFAADLQENERWIERTFGLTGRPFFRPPYGAYDAGTVAAAGAAGYTHVIMWNGTVADSSMRSGPYVLHAIRYWAKPGAIILMHGNYPTTARILPQILALLHRMRLRPVTLAELLGGSPYAAPPAGAVSRG
jgi:peptidoglycan/xylan/chitin deacetylase (PgdA/CDA1 family)